MDPEDRRRTRFGNKLVKLAKISITEAVHGEGRNPPERMSHHVQGRQSHIRETKHSGELASENKPLGKVSTRNK